MLLSQDGDEYIFGHEVSLSDTDPRAFDCSELIQWACWRIGVEPHMPDGSWLQARHCRDHRTLTSVENGIVTPGALLFRFSSSPFSGGRPSSSHVAVSQGDGRTIEARSSRHGVGQFSAHNRDWTHAGLVPGIDYEEDALAILSDEAQEHFQTVYEELQRLDPPTSGAWARTLIEQKRKGNFTNAQIDAIKNQMTATFVEKGKPVVVKGIDLGDG